MELIRSFLMLVMPILGLGLIVWLIETLWKTEPGEIKVIVRVLAGVLILLWLLQGFGLYSIPLFGPIQR